MNYKALNKLLGNIDIYLLDQILKGRFEKSPKILDAGCGEGRNLIYFLSNGYDVYGIDSNPTAIAMVRIVSNSLVKGYDTSRFKVSDIEAMPFAEAYFDAVICSAVLHFAQDEKHFDQLFEKLYTVLRPEGSLFIRMASDIGIESNIVRVGDGRFQLPDGSNRYLLTREKIKGLLQKHSLTLLEPIKTVNVNDRRCMTNLVLSKK